jgi:hypothetical protein
MQLTAILILFQIAGTNVRPPSTTPPAGPWQADFSAGVGILLGPGEIGRDVNAAGGDQLIARVRDGPAFRFGAALGIEYFRFGLDMLRYTRQVQVVNDRGVEFPNHGEGIFLYSATATLYPFAPIRGAFLADRLRPYAVAAAGGSLVSVDLDNVGDQTLYHPWQWSWGAGVRCCSSAPESLAFEARVTRFYVGGRGPLNGFSATTLMVGLAAEL